MSESRATVHIHRLFGDTDGQGKHVATVVVSDYKHACGNARDVFVREHRPPSGKYLCFTREQYGDQENSLIFDVKYAEAIITTNGRQDICGEDFSWSVYATGSKPEWGDVDFEHLTRSALRRKEARRAREEAIVGSD